MVFEKLGGGILDANGKVRRPTVVLKGRRARPNLCWRAPGTLMDPSVLARCTADSRNARTRAADLLNASMVCRDWRRAAMGPGVAALAAAVPLATRPQLREGRARRPEPNGVLVRAVAALVAQTGGGLDVERAVWARWVPDDRESGLVRCRTGALRCTAGPQSGAGTAVCGGCPRAPSLQLDRHPEQPARPRAV
jgi:hypothetical protein